MGKINKKSQKKVESKMAGLSQKWLDVLVPFSYDYNRRLSGSEVARETKIPKRSLLRYLNYLLLENILKFEDKGSVRLYYLDLSDERIGVILNLVESYKSFVFSRNSLLWKDLKCLVEFGTVVLFGSQVKGSSNSSSDIDVLIFSKESKRLKDTLRILKKVQAHIISFEDFEKLVFKKDVLSLEILRNHVIFGEIDKFVNLCRGVYG